MCGNGSLDKIGGAGVMQGWGYLTGGQFKHDLGNAPWTNTNNIDRWYHDSVIINDPAGIWLPGVASNIGGRVLGTNKRDEYRAGSAARRQEAFLKMQYAPAAPERTATFVNPNAELRDRRRRAVLFGQSQLEMPGVGAGGLGGGGYGGANVPLS